MQYDVLRVEFEVGGQAGEIRFEFDPVLVDRRADSAALHQVAKVRGETVGEVDGAASMMRQPAGQVHPGLRREVQAEAPFGVG